MSAPGPHIDEAPLLIEASELPPEASAVWVQAEDGVRLRLGHLAKGSRGTVLCFPGRTEYVEKYARVARHFAAHDLGLLVIDWRGQGLAQRLCADWLRGHVGKFEDYQLDVAAMVAHAETLDLPRPWYLLAHSMGGAIGLQAVQNGLPVQAVGFSAPMWNLTMTPLARPLAQVLPRLADCLGFGGFRVPGTGDTPYVLEADPRDNLLTSDPESFTWFRNQVAAHPALGLAGPSFRWLRESMAEFTRIRETCCPDLPCRIYLGDHERIVSPEAIRRISACWEGAVLQTYPGGEHEVLMEKPEIRQAILNDLAAFFASERQGH